MSLKKIIFLISASIFLMSTSLQAENEKECFEKISRGIFKFNQGFDRAILKPIAKGYNKLPDPIKKGTGNFTSNIGTLLTVPNHILQGQWKLAGESSASFLIKTTVGVLGFCLWKALRTARIFVTMIRKSLRALQKDSHGVTDKQQFGRGTGSAGYCAASGSQVRHQCEDGEKDVPALIFILPA